MPMVLIFFVATFGMNFQVTNALMSRQVFHTGADRVRPRVGGVRGRGADRGAARRPPRPARRAAAGDGRFAFGVLEVVTGLMPTFWSFLVLLVPTGLALLTFTTAANSATQLGTTPRCAAG